MTKPVRTASGDLAQPVALFAPDNPAQPLQGGDVPGKPIRTSDGSLVTRVAVYEVEGGVAVPVTSLGSDVGTDLTADPPLQITDTGDGTGHLSIDTDVPGGVPTLDGAGKVSASELPPAPLHETFEAADQAAMLAASVSAPAVAIRTDFSPAHLFYLHSDPASTLGNWEDLGAGVSAGADPSASVGTTPINGIAATYMRSDGAPRINQAMSPAWTGDHDFTGGTVAVPTPTTAGQAAPKGYVDSEVAGAAGTAAWGGIGGTLSAQADLNTALGTKADQSALTAHTSNTSNPHAVTKAQVGLGNVDNTSDADKPVSTAAQAALDLKLTTPTPLTTKIVLGTSLSQSTIGLVGYDQGALGDTLAMRQFGGQVTTATPTDDTHAATKAYVDSHAAGGTAAWGGITGTLASQSDLQAALDAKLTTPAPLTPKLVFGTPLAADTPGTVAYDVPATPNTLAMRTATGQVKTGTAADADDATPKAYVDGTVANVNNALTTHEGTTGAGTHLPSGGTSGQVPIKGAGDTVAWQDAPPATAVWGSVTGDIANQGDLQQELNGRVLLTSKATETEAQAGTDDTKWMSALNVAQAIAEHQQTVPETFTAHATLEAGTNDPTTGVEVLFGPTPSGGAFEAWQIDWVVYVSADPSGRVEFVIPAQTGITVVTSGIGPAVGGTGGAAASVDSTALIFQADAPTRLVRLTTFIDSAPGSHDPIQLMMRSPDSVTVSAAPGSHVVAHKLLTAT